jgi:hypothetical protein
MVERSRPAMDLQRHAVTLLGPILGSLMVIDTLITHFLQQDSLVKSGAIAREGV